MACFLCSSNKLNKFAQVESFGYPLTYYQCDRCGLVFQSRAESQAADPQFYARAYREIYQADPAPTHKDLWVQAGRAAHLNDFLRQQEIATPQRVLDVGASAGLLLEAFQKAWGCQVVGVEPGDAYRRFSEEKDIPMFSSLESLIASEPERFDLVSLSHVLEHLPDPVTTLQTIRRSLLADNGWLLLEVPNFYTHDSYELAHLACYTPHTLKEVARQAGYETVAVRRHGVPRSTILNLYLTLLARPLSEGAPIPTVKPESLVAEKRKVGLLYRRLVQKLFPKKAWLPLPEEPGDC